MIEKVATRLTETMVTKGIISPDNQDDCTFGLVLKITRSGITLSMLLISLITGVFFETILYCCVFLIIKNHTPGYDCPKYIQCYSLSISIYLSFVIFYRFTPSPQRLMYSPLWLLGFILVVAAKYGLLADKGQKFRFILKVEKKSLFIFLSFSLLSLLFTIFGVSVVSFTVAYAVFAATITYTPMEVDL